MFCIIMVKLTELRTSFTKLQPRVNGKYYLYTYTNVDSKKTVTPENSERQEYGDNVADFHSTLAHIDLTHTNNPMGLFGLWLKDVEERTTFIYAHTMHLASVSETGNVSNRVMIMTELQDDAFHFHTSKVSAKYKDIITHPQVALTFLWTYEDKDKMLSRQVRVEGIAQEKDRNYVRTAFDKSSIAHKFRNCLCRQSSPIKWEQLKQRHDDLLKHVKERKVQLNMPDHTIVFGVVPHRIEFYHSILNSATIPDRVLFTKNSEGAWNQAHLEA